MWTKRISWKGLEIKPVNVANFMACSAKLNFDQMLDGQNTSGKTIRKCQCFGICAEGAGKFYTL